MYTDLSYYLLRVLKSTYLKSFFESIGIPSEDVDIFIEEYGKNVNEYAFAIEDGSFEGLGISKKFEYTDVDWKALDRTFTTKQQVPRDFNIYWVKGGNGLRTYVFERFEDVMGYYNVFGEGDLRTVLDAFNGMNLKENNLGFVKHAIK